MDARLKVVELPAGQLPVLAAVYARAVVGTPLCWAGDGSKAQWAAEAQQALIEVTDTGSAACNRRRILLAVAAQRGPTPTAEEVLGFCDIGVWPKHRQQRWLSGSRSTQDDAPESGVVRFFWYQRGERAAGVLLLDAAERYFRSCGVLAVNAFTSEHRYPFCARDLPKHHA